MWPPSDPLYRLLSQRPSVLVVEDDDALRSSLAELITTEGYLVVSAANGQEALRFLERGLRPFLILLDIMMPVMDGWDFRTRQLRAYDCAEIPIAVLTATGFSKQTVQQRFGQVPFFPKPIDIEGLLMTVRSAATA